MEELLQEIGIISIENPDWEVKHFDRYGSFVGPKHICDMIEQMLEEEI